MDVSLSELRELVMETRARKHHFLEQNLQVHPKRFSIQ